MAPTSNAGSVESTSEAGNNVSIATNSATISNDNDLGDGSIDATDDGGFADVQHSSADTGVKVGEPKFKSGDHAVVVFILQDGSTDKHLAQILSVKWNEVNGAWEYESHVPGFPSLTTFQERSLQKVPHQIGNFIKHWSSGSHVTHDGLSTITGLCLNPDMPGGIEYTVQWMGTSKLSTNGVKAIDMGSITTAAAQL
jgi:hypothetical protein